MTDAVAGAPIELLRSLEREADDPAHVALSAAAEGSHLVACRTEDAGGSGPGVVIVTSAGSARHQLAIASLVPPGSDNSIKVSVVKKLCSEQVPSNKLLGNLCNSSGCCILAPHRKSIEFRSSSEFPDLHLCCVTCANSRCWHRHSTVGYICYESHA